MRKYSLRRYGHIIRRDNLVTMRVIMEGKKGKGRLKKRWVDEIENGMKIAGDNGQNVIKIYGDVGL